MALIRLSHENNSACQSVGSVLALNSRVKGSNPYQDRNLFLNFGSTCTPPIELSYTGILNPTLSEGRLGSKKDYTVRVEICFKILAPLAPLTNSAILSVLTAAKSSSAGCVDFCCVVMLIMIFVVLVCLLSKKDYLLK